MDAGTAIGIAALVLTIPQTVLAVMDVKDRLKERRKKKKLADGFIKKAGELQQKRPKAVIRVRGARGSTLRIETLDGNTLIDIASAPKS